ncbi:peptidase C14, caspase catalytic subunit p20 [Burkholderia sp. KJ006]|nr:peptidase C14, caspase catalytic subunit p20 [Burkholderia sp. KJ006]
MLVAGLMLTLLAGLSCADTVPVPLVPSLSRLPAWAQIQKPPVKRALVVGIGDYEYATKLSTPTFDAAMVATALKKIDANIVVTLLAQSETTRRSFLAAVQSFASSIQPGDVAFVFFSGHGLERYDVNYLVPMDAKIAASGHEGLTYVSLPWIIEQLQDAQAGISVVILDACRADPFAGSRDDILSLPAVATSVAVSGTDSATSVVATKFSSTSALSATPSSSVQPRAGLSKMSAPQGFLIAYAAEPGKPSYSLFMGETPDKGSIFTRRFVALASKLNKPLEMVLGSVGDDVSSLTDQSQKPFLNASAAGEVLLMDNMNLEEDERETWIRTVMDSEPSDQLSELRLFLSMYPAGPYSAAARDRIKALEGTSSAPATVVTKALPATAIVLSGSLKTPSITQPNVSTAIAEHDVFLRATPVPLSSKILGVVRKGEEVRILQGVAREGWSKVLRQDGVVGFVGSILVHDTSPASSILSVEVEGDQLPDLVKGPQGDHWAQALGQTSSVVHVDVRLSSDPNTFKARQQAFLRALRIRAALISQGVDTGRISMTLGGGQAAANTATVSISQGAVK